MRLNHVKLTTEGRWLYNLITDIIEDIGENKWIYLSAPSHGYEYVILAMLCFLTGGLTGRNDLARELMLYYIQFAPESFTPEQKTQLIDYTHELYQYFREVGIAHQEEDGLEEAVKHLSRLTVRMIQGSPAVQAENAMINYTNYYIQQGLNKISA